MELGTEIVIDGPNGNTTGWKITGEVINYKTTSNQDHKIDIEEVIEVIEEVSEEGKLIMKRSLPSKKRNLKIIHFPI